MGVLNLPSNIERTLVLRGRFGSGFSVRIRLYKTFNDVSVDSINKNESTLKGWLFHAVTKDAPGWATTKTTPHLLSRCMADWESNFSSCENESL
jgi:hypothetical protein